MLKQKRGSAKYCAIIWFVHVVYMYLLFSGCATSGTFRTNRGQEITMNPFRIRNVYVFGIYEDNIFKMASVNQTGDFVENRYHESDIMTEDMNYWQREEIWDTSRSIADDHIYSVDDVIICGTKHLHLREIF